ncbi:MAG TPA: hypothetical protein VGD74_01585 [Vulgatibacter sp.]
MADARWIADGCAEARRAIEAGEPREASRILRWMADEVRRRHHLGGRSVGQVADGSQADRILGVVELTPDRITSEQIGQSLGLTSRQVRDAIKRLVRRGHLTRTGRGEFRLGRSIE